MNKMLAQFSPVALFLLKSSTRMSAPPGNHVLYPPLIYYYELRPAQFYVAHKLYPIQLIKPVDRIQSSCNKLCQQVLVFNRKWCFESEAP
jgi:hypothetical protein